MLIHLTPAFFLQYSNVFVDLIDVSIPECDLVLKNNIDLMVKTPYPNKYYKVACRKKGRKAINGFFIETDKIIQYFTVIIRWSVTGIGGDNVTDTVSHKIHFHVNDTEYDAVTDYQFLWYGFHNTPFRSRMSESQKDWILATEQPRMSPTLKDAYKPKSERLEQIYYELNENRLITKRVEYYVVPSVERERLATPFFGNDRLPALDDAFKATIIDYPYTVKPTEFFDLGICSTPFSEFADDECSGIIESSHFHAISKEIKDKADRHFFSNTNDLINKARLHSDTYNKLEASEQEFIDKILSQALFILALAE